MYPPPVRPAATPKGCDRLAACACAGVLCASRIHEAVSIRPFRPCSSEVSVRARPNTSFNSEELR